MSSGVHKANLNLASIDLDVAQKLKSLQEEPRETCSQRTNVMEKTWLENSSDHCTAHETHQGVVSTEHLGQLGYIVRVFCIP